MIVPNLTEKISCPCSNGGNAFKDSYDNIEVLLCSTCGLMSTSQYYEGSDYVEQIKKLCPPEILFISIVDENNFRWFPSVLPYSKKGVIVAEPTGKNEFNWHIIPLVKVSEAESYLYINQETNKPYEYRLAQEKAIIFKKDEFMNVLEMADTPDSKQLLQRIKEIFF